MGAPIVEQGGVAPHQGDGQPLEEPVRGGGLLLSGVVSLCTTQSLDFKLLSFHILNTGFAALPLAHHRLL